MTLAAALRRERRRLPQRPSLPAAIIACLFLSAPALAAGAGEGHAIGDTLPLWSTLPFAAILLAIALGPLVAPRFWHHHYPKVAIGIALSFAVPFLIVYRGQAWHEILHTYLIDYFPFIILLWGLFTVAGGIVLSGTLAGTPAVNTGFILVGTLIASWMGTTGAAMLLIRPVLRANAHRMYKSHVIVFFIFLVANIGGSLTPLGDPPLFLGFLHGVPFFWTLRLLSPMAFVGLILLVIFYVIDRRYHEREKLMAAARAAAAAAGTEAPADPPAPAPPAPRERLGLSGAHNFIFLAGIIGAVLVSGIWNAGRLDVLGVEVQVQNLARDAVILLMGFLSLATTSQALRRANGFSWAPIREVAYLFAGIFMTIIPALAILKAGEHGHLAFLIRAVTEPAHYFWATGILSSLLDNAPTYLAFFNSLLGRFYPGIPEAAAVSRLVVDHAIYLEAVAAGAVFMGANTYIGNAPNFMVRSIAEDAGVAMPSFLGYLVRWTLPVLFPVFLLATWVFLR